MPALGHRFLSTAALLVALTGAGALCRAAEPLSLDNVEPPSKILADEPLASEFSLVAAARYLDSAALWWQKTHACTSCHTMVSYMMSRQALQSIAPPPPDVRRFFEDVVDGRRQAMPDYHCGDVDAAVAIVVAAALAFDDRLSTGRLDPHTRRALDRMWQLQRADGAWDWSFRDTPPLKLREHYGAALAAITAGMAPGDYAQTEPARRGLELLAGYFRANPPETLHEDAMLTWASMYVPDLSTDDQRRQTIDRLLGSQRPDGGWSMASLVENPSSPLTATADAAARLRSEPGHGIEFLVYAGRDAAYKSSLASDGYATGLAIYVARQAGVPASNERLRRGVDWLQAHQRASGRWFTPSQAWHTQNLIANAGTAYAVLALDACGEVPGSGFGHRCD